MERLTLICCHTTTMHNRDSVPPMFKHRMPTPGPLYSTGGARYKSILLSRFEVAAVRINLQAKVGFKCFGVSAFNEQPTNIWQ